MTCCDIHLSARRIGVLGGVSSLVAGTCCNLRGRAKSVHCKAQAEVRRSIIGVVTLFTSSTTLLLL